MNTECLAKLAELKATKKAQKDAMKDTESQIAEVEAEVLDMLQEAGIDSVKAHGHTFYLRHEVNPKMASGPDAVSALISAGMIDCTMTSHRRFASVARESIKAYLEENPLKSSDEALEHFYHEHPELNGMVNVYEEYKVGMRKA